MAGCKKPWLTSVCWLDHQQMLRTTTPRLQSCAESPMTGCGLLQRCRAWPMPRSSSSSSLCSLSVQVFICPSVCQSVCLSVNLSVYLSVYVCVSVFVSLSVSVSGCGPAPGSASASQLHFIFLSRSLPCLTAPAQGTEQKVTWCCVGALATQGVCLQTSLGWTLFQICTWRLLRHHYVYCYWPCHNRLTDCLASDIITPDSLSPDCDMASSNVRNDV